IEERLRLAFDVDDQRPGYCRLAIAPHQMHPQRLWRGAGGVQGFLEIGGALQGRPQIGRAECESLCRCGASITLAEFLDRGFQFSVRNLGVQGRGPVVALPGLDVVKIDFDWVELTTIKPDRLPPRQKLIDRRRREYRHAPESFEWVDARFVRLGD